MNATQRLLVPLAAALAAGCQSPGAVFVTKSSLAIADIDSTPAEMTVAMHRVEGFIAPRNQNGNTPPVLAHITSNRDLLSPEVTQVYATGTAAERIAGDFKNDNSECDSCRESQDAAMYTSPVIFATSTTVGLRIGLTTENLVDGLVLGYRRKEMSFVPSLARDKDGTYRYPSLIAAIHLKTGDPASRQPGFRACQGFATGTAATRLAESNNAGLGCLSENESLKALLTAKDTANLRQQAEIERVLSCYVELPPERKLAARANAAKLGLVAGRGAGLLPTSDGAALKEAFVEDGWYVSQLLEAVVPEAKDGANAGMAKLREHQLRAHREVVCTAVRREQAAAKKL